MAAYARKSNVPKRVGQELRRGARGTRRVVRRAAGKVQNAVAEVVNGDRARIPSQRSRSRSSSRSAASSRPKTRGGSSSSSKSKSRSASGRSGSRGRSRGKSRK